MANMIDSQLEMSGPEAEAVAFREEAMSWVVPNRPPEWHTTCQTKVFNICKVM